MIDLPDKHQRNGQKVARLCITAHNIRLPCTHKRCDGAGNRARFKSCKGVRRSRFEPRIVRGFASFRFLADNKLESSGARRSRTK